MGKNKVRKKRSAWEIVFMLLNTVLVCGIIGFYVNRLFTYKEYFDQLYYDAEEEQSSLLYEILKAKVEILDSNNGLIKNPDGETYTYKGNVSNNYISWNNRLYRMLGIDENGSIKIITENVETKMLFYERYQFEQTSIFRWLNYDDSFEVDGINVSGVYEKALVNPYECLINVTNNTSIIDDLSNIGGVETEKNYKFSLPTIEEYTKASGANGFLNNGTEFWLANTTADGRHWYIDEEGNLGLAEEPTEFHNIRVIMNLNYEINVLKGTGTKDNPYVIEYSNYTEEDGPKQIKTISDMMTGHYVEYSGHKWIFSSAIEEGNAVLMMEDVLKDEEGNPVLKAFGEYNIYTPSKKGTAAYYLNKDFLKTLNKHEDYLVSTDWFCGTFTTEGAFDYREGCTDSYNCYVAIPMLGYMYLDGSTDIFLGNTAFQTDKLVYIISEYNRIYSDLLENEHSLRPVICMKGTVEILSGTGTYEDPFVVEVSE